MKFKWLTHSKKFALGFAYTALAVLVAYGILARAYPKKTTIGPNPITPGWQQEGKVKFKANLSQTKVVQGSDGLI
jgi:hypothetical protein